MIRPLDGAPSPGREFDNPQANGPAAAHPQSLGAAAGSGLRPPLLPEQPEALIALVLEAPTQGVNLRFLTHRPDMLGVQAARLVYGLRALQRWIRRSKAEPGELERWLGPLLGVAPGDIRRPAAGAGPGPRAEQPGLADVLANQVEDELASCGLYPSLAAHIHQALPRNTLAQLQRASQSGSGWIAFTTYPEFCLKRGLGAAADRRFATPASKPDNLPLARKVVSALSAGLDGDSQEAIAQEVAIAITPADMHGLLTFAQSDLARTWIDLQPALRQRADAIFERPEVQQRLGERLRRLAVPVRPLKLRPPPPPPPRRP